SREVYGEEPPEVSFELPDSMTDAETVAIIYDEAEGMLFLRNFGLLEEAFGDPQLAASRRHREALLGQLKEPDLTPLPFRRLGARDPERASRLFALLLKRPDFS